MAKLFTFLADDSLVVVDAVAGIGATWTIRPEQVAKHRPMFDGDITPQEKAKCDAIALRVTEAEAAAVAARLAPK